MGVNKWLMRYDERWQQGAWEVDMAPSWEDRLGAETRQAAVTVTVA